jgi:glycosyltransferase involved in cell wall biosynthesis
VAAVAPHAADKITVVPNGIDMAWFHPIDAALEGPVRFAVVGRLEPVKRVHLAIEAVAQVPGVHLTIAGDGQERRRLEQLVRDLRLENRVQFLGQVGDTRPVLAACDALINTTRDEGLGLAVIEAAAMEKPAIAFASGGIPEIVEDGQTGWLVKAETAAGLAAVLAEASADRARLAAMGKAARQWVETRFGLDAMCVGYAEVYEELRRIDPAAHQLAGQHT